MSNHMKEVAYILGVEPGEEFEVDYGNGKTAIAKITKCGLHIIHVNFEFYGDLNRATLDWLLGGVCNVIHKRWKPSITENYYYIDIDVIVRKQWARDVIDISLYKLGNCYRTKQEAEENRDKWIAFYSSDEILEV